MILAPVYYRCPMLCTQILNGLASSLKAVSLDPGKDFEIVAVSFDPKDTPKPPRVRSSSTCAATDAPARSTAGTS